jgi:hypothetical protein
MTKTLYHYMNGNYTVTILSDGTKVRETQGDSFLPEFSENIDIKITNYCDANCAWCHEKSTMSGEHGNLLMPYLDTLMSGTELAIGGGNPLSHPQLIPFLEKLKEVNVIANITVNQFHFKQSYFRRYLDGLVKFGLVHGVGLSMKTPDDDFIQGVKQYDNAVIHTINGINPVHHFELLSGQGLKVLILGYKDFGRGCDYLNPQVIERKAELYDCLPALISTFKGSCCNHSGMNSTWEMMEVTHSILTW